MARSRVAERRKSSGFKTKNTMHLKRKEKKSLCEAASDVQYQFRSLRREEEAVCGNRIMSLQQLIFLLNTVARDHLQRSCRQPDLKIEQEVKFGLGSKISFQCKTCAYTTGLMKTYEEVPGSRRGIINTALASAVMDTPMGLSRAEQLFTQLDLPFPAASGLQKLTKAVGEEVVQLNKEDMSTKRNLVRQHAIESGAHDPNVLDLSIDARYNSSRMTSSYKPGQSSSQAYMVAMENHTDQKYIVGLEVENKLCYIGTALKNKGIDVDCPGDHAGCTANLPYFTPHSERRMAHNMAQDLALEGYFVRTITTDGDKKSFLGMQDFYSKLDQAWEVARQADPNHLASTQERKIRNAAFSPTMFVGATTKMAQKKSQGTLARDVKARCSAVVEEMARRGQGDITTFVSNLPDIQKATVECYAGNCSLCPQSALVCTGVGSNCWWDKSRILGPNGITQLKMSENDKLLLAVILQVRLSEEAIYKVSSRTSTQKCEALNRAVLSTLPKCQNYSRAFTARLAQHTMRSNNSVDTAVKMRLTRLTKTRLSPSATKRLLHISQRARSEKLRKNTKKFKERRRFRRAQMEFDHRHARDTIQHTEPDYIKGVLDDNLHTYASTSSQK